MPRTRDAMGAPVARRGVALAASAARSGRRSSTYRRPAPPPSRSDAAKVASCARKQSGSSCVTATLYRFAVRQRRRARSAPSSVSRTATRSGRRKSIDMNVLVENARLALQTNQHGDGGSRIASGNLTSTPLVITKIQRRPATKTPAFTRRREIAHVAADREDIAASACRRRRRPRRAARESARR